MTGQPKFLRLLVGLGWIQSAPISCLAAGTLSVSNTRRFSGANLHPKKVTSKVAKEIEFRTPFQKAEKSDLPLR
jgi:hypothetical protein